jgi:predicted dinucleotide-binding enzyme
MKIAIIGAGNVGTALAKGWVRAGHTVIFGVRAASQDKARASVGSLAKLAEPAAAAAEADVVVLATPWGVSEQAAKDLGDLKGKPLIDATNPLEFKDGALHLIRFPGSSGGEKIAAAAPTASVYKTMNQVGFEVMADTAGFGAKPMMFVAGADGFGKTAVMQLVADLGFDAIDAGTLSMAGHLEHLAHLWITLAFRKDGRRAFTFARVTK